MYEVALHSTIEKLKEEIYTYINNYKKCMYM